MHHESSDLEEALIYKANAGSVRAPEEFFRLVRARRRHVRAMRAFLALSILISAGAGLWILRPSDRVRRPEPTQIVTISSGPTALRRLRELPADAATGPGPAVSLRVLDARNPDMVSGMGGF